MVSLEGEGFMQMNEQWLKFQIIFIHIGRRIRRSESSHFSWVTDNLDEQRLKYWQHSPLRSVPGHRRHIGL
jgi:hypothetical protein